MTIAYVFGGMHNEGSTAAPMYERYAAARATYRQVEEWTGYDPDQLLGRSEPPLGAPARRVKAIRQAAQALAVHDVLTELGVRPSVTGGLSLGAQVAACIAGAVSREALFTLFARSWDEPGRPGGEAAARAQGVAFVGIPVGEDPDGDAYAPDRVGGSYRGVDLGPVGDGTMRCVMFSGYLDQLERLAESLPPGHQVAKISAELPATHSPIQQHISDAMAAEIAGMVFTDPDIPVCSCLETRTLTTAGDVRDLFLRITTTGVSVPKLLDGLMTHGPGLAVVLGPSQFDRYLRSRVPVAHVERPGQVEGVLQGVGAAPAVRRLPAQGSVAVVPGA
ncbi:hypothetical protein LKL35_14440 [Streptomyces sp. ET3-23]|uniref:hypothetical protein n=1 Tax=Streptomyces sp. ET3-23 TaxID=2885643 RepID=UPI001D0F9EE8|nr:hypothetical protein [Streptomyces sp. ET3-23]MCC2276598.1 hypothetical protein [Streptomyces sp. ET3-23]